MTKTYLNNVGSIVVGLLLYTVGFGQRNNRPNYEMVPDTGVTIIPAGKKFYTDASNTVIVTKANRSFRVEASQGFLDTLSGGMYELSKLTSGKVTIKVSKPVDTGYQLIISKTVVVDKRQLTSQERKFLTLKIKPEICIGAYTSGDKIPISVVRNATKFEINSPYKLNRAMVFVVSQGYDGFSVSELHSAEFDEAAKRLLSRARVGNTIGFDEISVVDKKGEIYHPASVIFKVVAD